MELKDLINCFRKGIDFTVPTTPSYTSEPSYRTGSWNSTHGKYLYRKLPPHCIRVLKLEPADAPDAPIILSMEVAGLTHPAPFEALSYVWGKREPLVQVTCNGFRVDITPNLALALLHIRRPIKLGARKIWVDAICINQDSESERSAQVMKMKDIYSKASCVLIWLGDANINEETFGTAAKHISSLAKFLRNGSESTTPNLHQIAAILKQPDQPVTFEFRKWLENTTNWQFIRSILASTWFTRVWIIQEFAQAKDVKIMIGSYMLPSFDFFLCALYVKKNHYNLSPLDEERLDHVIRIYNMRFRNHLLPQIEAASMFMASNPRDKIYAVLGLPAVENDRDFDKRSLLRADYTKPTWKVYGDVVRHFISLPRERECQAFGEQPVGGQKYGEGVLDILRPPVKHGLLGDKEKCVVSTDEWPSWVPRWDLIDNTYRHPPGIWAMNPKYLWRPSGETAVKYSPPIDEGMNRVLELKGVKVGVVEMIFDGVLQGYTMTERNSKVCVKTLLKRVQAVFEFDLNKPFKQYHGPGTLEADFAEVITAGSLTELSPKDSTSSMETLRKVVGTEGLVLQEWLSGTRASSKSSKENMDGEKTSNSSQTSSKKSVEKEFKKWLEADEGKPLTRQQSLPDDSVLNRFGRSVNLNRTVFITEDGRIGIGSNKIRVGDEVWMLYGGRCLYVVREGQETTDFELAKTRQLVGMKSPKGDYSISPKKFGVFGFGKRPRSRDSNVGDALNSDAQKKGSLGFGMRQQSRDGHDARAESASPPKSAFLMGLMGRRSRESSEGAMGSAPAKKRMKGKSRSRGDTPEGYDSEVAMSQAIPIPSTDIPSSPDIKVDFEDDLSPSPPNKHSIWDAGTSLRAKSIGLMMRRTKEDSKEPLTGLSDTTSTRVPSEDRPLLQQKVRLFVGEAFVGGWMENEAVSAVHNGDLDEGWLILI
ncbi:hypothetical protein HYFRA_00005413 [Hymenoscyphus fraxineus]|uniref:Heterokaryon incompatibility domain-containing protein n=1 Tax=Hymenoscyphus fraxineus TaxID=746836 RepID=A0A9N9KS05_9HELO|nr:hypothetical protein HYFRA_00005413 [Hymenoscyphus fraxineus]